MPGSTTNLALPYPVGSDAPNGPQQIQDLASGIDATLLGVIKCTSSTRPPGRAGSVIYETDTKLHRAYSAATSQWHFYGAPGPASKTVFSTTTTSSLVTSANTDTAVPGLSMSYDFKAGLAYEITYWYRFSMSGGTSPYAAFSKVKRASSSGTIIHDPGNVAAIGGQFMSTGVQSCVVKCSADTTQTIVVTAAYTTTGTPTAINIQGGTGAQNYLRISLIGESGDNSNAMEIPTS